MPLIKHNVLICKRLRDFRGNKIHTKFIWTRVFFRGRTIMVMDREEYDDAMENFNYRI